METVLLILLQSQSPPHTELCGLASQRVKGQSPDSGFLVNWLVVWLQLDAVPALGFLSRYTGELEVSDADELMLRLCYALTENRLSRVPHLAKPDYLQPNAMRVWVPLVYRHIRPSEDVDRPGGVAFSPTMRDEAQQFRNSLLGRLADLDAPNVLQTLEELAEAVELAPHHDYIRHLAYQRLERDLDLHPWGPDEIRRFPTDFEIDPRDDTDLFHIACWRLEDIRREIKFAENSLRDEVQDTWDEPALRRWLQRKLRDRSRKHYTIPQEAEIDQQQRPDLRFENAKIGAAVSVEIKWSHRWSARNLLERLDNQLVGQYMRAYNARYGIYVLGHIDPRRHWKHPSSGARLGFAQVLELIEEKAIELEQAHPDVAGIRVVSLDFTIP